MTENSARGWPELVTWDRLLRLAFPPVLPRQHPPRDQVDVAIARARGRG